MHVLAFLAPTDVAERKVFRLWIHSVDSALTFQSFDNWRKASFSESVSSRTNLIRVGELVTLRGLLGENLRVALYYQLPGPCYFKGLLCKGQ